MSQISVRQPHKLSRDDAKSKLSEFESMLGKYRVTLTWKGYQATVSGIGVSGTVDVNPADVSVLLQLGFLAKAAGVDATRLQQSIAKRLSSAYAASP